MLIRLRAGYEGEFLEALPGGRGVMFTEKSVKYYGDWSQGARNGSGVYVWPDGSEYRGSFRGAHALTPRPPHVYVQLEFSMVVEYKSCPAFCGEVDFVFASMQEA